MFIFRKGQTRIVGEMLLFAVGVLILSYIIVTFGIVQTGVYDLSVNDQLQGIANHVKSAAMKLTSTDDAVTSMIIDLPLTLSGQEYVIKLMTDETTGKPMVNVSIITDPDRHVNEELFNTGSVYNIAETVLRSSSAYYIIKLESDTLSMEYYKFS